MSNSAAITKIEQVTEVIESLIVASVDLQLLSPSRIRHENVRDARDELSTALKDFLTPTLRVVTTEETRTVGPVSKTARTTTITGVREIVEHIPAPDARPTYPTD
jgi:hypothetical protein